LGSWNYGPSLDRDFGIRAAVVGKAGARFVFEVGRIKLFLSYLATDRDTPPAEFLDDFAKALRPE